MKSKYYVDCLNEFYVINRQTGKVIDSFITRSVADDYINSGQAQLDDSSNNN